jgi:predicted RND superfamily exporter protein
VLKRLRRLHPVRLARPISRRPGTVALVAALVCALLGLGFLRYTVDAGADLLVGSNSDAKQFYDRFASHFGADPIVVVLKADNPTAFYLERNLQRLAALETDVTRDPRVASVLGPGTVAVSANAAANNEVSKVEVEYPYFVAETALATAIANGEQNAQNLTTIENQALRAASVSIAADIVKAAQLASQARTDYTKNQAAHAGDKILDDREKAAAAATASVPLPPLFAQYIAGPQGKADENQARQLW